jgi:hypothetical protein
MQNLLYCVVCFKVQGTTQEVFVDDDVDVTLANCRVSTRRYAYDAEVASA